MTGQSTEKRIFTLGEAQQLLPEVKRVTQGAYESVARIIDSTSPSATEAETLSQANDLIASWIRSIIALGCDVKGLWLVDFDCGHGYFCWQHPEQNLSHYHSYDDGLAGRMKII